MALVTPFHALRPHSVFAAAVAALPYDVMSVAEAQALVRKNPHSFLHVEKSEIDVPEATGTHDPAIFAQARKSLDILIAQGVMIQDASPCFYIYRQTMNGRRQDGLVATLSVAEYESGLIKKHEHTRADKELERTLHVEAVGAQTGPVFIAYPQDTAIDALIAQKTAGEPTFEFVAEDGIGHAGWLIRDPAAIFALEEAFAAHQALYIADGHHRAAAACAVARMRRERGESSSGHERFLAVLFPADQLRILDYNRAVKDLNGLSAEAFLARIEQAFEVSDAFPERSPATPGTFGMYLAGRWRKLTAKPGTFDPADPVKSLDVAILQDNLLGPILGIADPRRDTRIDFIGGIRGMEALERLVDGGGFAVAFSLCPTSLEQLMRVADAGEVMPPKSTWFEPKLRSGLFVHRLDD